MAADAPPAGFVRRILNWPNAFKGYARAKTKAFSYPPFDPVLWDRTRVRRLFGFDQVLEIFKPAHQRVYGYYCLPVLAGEKLMARVAIKADRKIRKLHVLSYRFETDNAKRRVSPADRKALRSAVTRYAAAIGMQPVGLPK